MARQEINTGAFLGDRTGDNGRVAFTKVNENFAELYVNHAQTAAEIAAGVTPTNYGYPPGDIRRYGENTTPGTTDMSAAVQAACDVYLAGEAAFVYVAEGFACASDVPDIHSVQLRGPGYIEVGDGRPWWAEPSEFNSTFAVPMTLYLAPGGSNSNSGLSDDFPLLTLQACADILEKLSPLRGFWRIIHAAGTYTVKGQFFGLRNTHAGSPLYISGPAVTAWSQADEPADVNETGGNIPTAIYDGSGQGSSWAIDAQSRTHIIVEDIKFTDWGTKATDSDDGAIRAQNWSSAIAKNCHAWNCTTGAMGRESSYIQTEGGYYNNNRRGCWAIMARYQTGRGATSAGDNAATLFVENSFGLDVWEGGNGHNDYAHFRDNTVQCYIRKGGHSAMNGPTLERTTGTVIGIQVQDGGNYRFDGTQVWTGTHTPRVRQLNFGVHADEVGTNWRCLGAGSLSATSDTDEHVIGSGITVPRECFVGGVTHVNALKITAWGTVANTNSTVTFRLNFNSGAVFSCSLASNATTHNWRCDILVFATTTNGQRSIMNLRRFDSTGTTAVIDDAILQTTEDFTGADQTVTFSVQCANASDAVSVSACLYERLG
jgi:hypothetical protein